jgi:hypothetical protein
MNERPRRAVSPLEARRGSNRPIGFSPDQIRFDSRGRKNPCSCHIPAQNATFKTRGVRFGSENYTYVRAWLAIFWSKCNQRTMRTCSIGSTEDRCDPNGSLSSETVGHHPEVV